MTIKVASNEVTFLEEIRLYIDAARHIASVADRRAYFMSIVRDYLGVTLGESDTESMISSGECTEQLGNLVFVFKSNLHHNRMDLELRLHQCVTDQDFSDPKSNYYAIVTDGLHFHIYVSPSTEDSQITAFKIISGLNFASPLITPELAAQDLRAILAQFRRE